MLAGRESPYPEQTVIEQYFTKQPTAAFVRLNQLNYTNSSDCLSLCLTISVAGFYRFLQGSGS